MSGATRHVYVVIYSQRSNQDSSRPYKDPACISNTSSLTVNDLNIKVQDGWRLDTFTSNRQSFGEQPTVPESLTFFVENLPGVVPINQTQGAQRVWVCDYADNQDDAQRILHREIAKEGSEYGMSSKQDGWRYPQLKGEDLGAFYDRHETQSILQYWIHRVLVRGD